MYMAGRGIEPKTLASLVMCSTTEIPRPISIVHLAPTTTTVHINNFTNVIYKVYITHTHVPNFFIAWRLLNVATPLIKLADINRITKREYLETRFYYYTWKLILCVIKWYPKYMYRKYCNNRTNINKIHA